MSITTSAPNRIHADALSTLIDGRSPLHLIDVRSPAEFESAHIPGALNLPLDVITKHAMRVHSKAQHPVVLICQAGPRAAQAGEQLNAVGLADTKVLDGGMGHWDDGQRPVNRGTQRWSLERQVRLVAGSIVLSGIAASLVRPRAKFVSGGIGAGLAFSALSDTCAMGNLLSHLPYNRTTSYNLESNLSRLGR